MSKKTQLVLVKVAVTILIILSLPTALIWAVNTLFVLNIQYDFWNWLAALVLIGLANFNRG